MASIAVTDAPAKSRTKRSLWWRVHQWAGLQLSLVLTLILATGTLATLSHEIDWLLTPAMRVTPRDGPLVSWGALGRSAQLHAGNARVEWLHGPSDPWFAAEAIVQRPNGDRFRVQLDPWTGEARGITPWFNTQRLFRELHRNLMLPTAIGVPIVTVLAFPLLASVVTALWVYKKWWRGFFRMPRRRKDRRNDGRRFTGDLHRFVGLWSLWFVALISVTGVWYFAEKMGAAAPVPRPPGALAPAQASGRHLDDLVAKARKSFPDLRITSIGFPSGNPGGIVIMGQAEAMLVRERANAVMLDPDSQTIIKVVRGEQLSLHQRISEAADPLHFGTWGGLSIRILWFFCGAALTGLAVTGVLIHALRLQQEAAARKSGGILAAIWGGMGIMAWPSLVSLILAFALIPTKLAGG